MSRLRLIFACSLALLSADYASAQAAGPAQPAPVRPPPAPPHAVAPAEPQTTFSSVHVDGPYVAMTFDDGPSEKLTPKLLDILAAHHMKVTFFVLGECVEQNPDVLRRAAREGHEIANHSWSHPNLGKMSDDGVRSQLKRTDDLIHSIIGVRPTLMRPPYGSITARQKHWIADEFGYRIILWDVDPLDWKRPGAAVVRNRIVKEARPGSIILAHDIHPQTIDAMPATFDELQAKGLKFVTVTELLGMATPVPPKPANVPPAAAPAQQPPRAEPAASPPPQQP
jgi:peptidoglycan/xylan/chitin deacetylase (PgdA/CDA1 family)